MLLEMLIIVAGIIIILGLAEVIIKNSVLLARHLGWSSQFIGLTVLSVGTSIPEIMTHVIGSVNILQDPSTMDTFSALLLGSNIGSDMVQQLFILGMIGIIGTVVVSRRDLSLEVGALVTAAVLLLTFCLNGFISRIEGLIMVILYLLYLWYLKKSTINRVVELCYTFTKAQLAQACGLILICFLMMAIVADKVLDASIILIQSFKISASFFGVALLGVAAAMPEFLTALIAVVKKQKGMSAGILIGSNVTNPLFALGIGAMISNYTVPGVVVMYDLPAKVITGGLIFYLFFRRQRLNKFEAALLILFYGIYLWMRYWFYPVDF